jgi:hypothetical protein
MSAAVKASIMLGAKFRADRALPGPSMAILEREDRAFAMT